MDASTFWSLPPALLLVRCHEAVRQNSAVRDIYRSRTSRLAASAVTLAVLGGLGACGGGGTDTPGPDASAATSAPDLGFAVTPAAYRDPYSGALDAAAQAPAVAQMLARGIVTADKVSGDMGTPASDLAAQLTSLLATHVYAVGSAVSTTFQTDQKSPQAEAAWAAVEANSKTLIRLVESLQAEANGDAGSGGRGNSRPVAAGPTPPPNVVSPESKAARGKDDDKSPSPKPTSTEPPFDLDDYDFGKAWREHVGYLTDYALAVRGSSTADQKTARRELDRWALQAGQYFREITKGRISSSTVRSDLGKYLDAITEAIDGISAKEGESFVKLREGADEMPETTARLAAGLASATDRTGRVDDDASELRNKLTATMTGHSYLAVMSFQVAFAQSGKSGLVSAQYRRVQVSLDDNSKQIAAEVSELGGPMKEAEFLQAWRIYLRNLENYARAAQTGDLEGRRTATDSLNKDLGTISTFFTGVSKGAIDADNADKRLRAELAAMIGVVDALQVAFR